MEGLRYRLAIAVRAESLEFEGRVELGARELPTALRLDSVGHRIRSVRSGDRAVPFEREADGVHLAVREIPPGTTSLTIEYSGTIDDPGLRGFYVSPYGAGRLYTTYFEPAGARRFLPCLDRPDEKAVFEVEVTAPSPMAVISNTEPEGSEELADGRRRTRFRPTPPMATYLLYVGIGPIEERWGTGTAPRVAVATSAGRSEGAEFALSAGERAVAYFEQYYGIPYPLSKLHLIAVPQFGTGAMENWGAITFQEHLLVHDARTPISAKMTAAEVICHEVAHQWFGDLVTMRGWNDLWLNESFASFVAVQASESLFPGWGAWDAFLSQRYAGSMLWDALPHTHPIRVDVEDPLEVRQIFDEISYGKGSSVLRMAEAYVGEEAFRRGVSAYLVAHRNGNATSSDLWRSIAAASSPSVERLFSEWVGRPGFPIVRVRRAGRELRFSQRRFGLLGESDEAPWPIPLRVQTESGLRRVLFDRPEVSLPADGGPVLLDPGRTGYYRVLYEGELREEILRRYSALAPVDRWGLLNDGRALLLAGAIDLEAFLALLPLLAAESDPFVVHELVDLFQTMYPVAHALPRLEATLREVVRAQSERLGLRRRDSESDRDRSLREWITFARVRLDPAFAQKLAQQYPQRESADPELRRAIVSAYAVGAGPAEYAALRADLAAADSAETKGVYAAALGLVPRNDWLRAGLEMLLTGELFLGPWIALFASAAFANPDRVDALWGFLSERIEPFLKVTAGTSAQAILLQFSVPAVALARPAEVRAWAARTTFPESALGVTKGLDLAEVVRRLLERASAGAK